MKCISARWPARNLAYSTTGVTLQINSFTLAKLGDGDCA